MCGASKRKIIQEHHLNVLRNTTKNHPIVFDKNNKYVHINYLNMVYESMSHSSIEYFYSGIEGERKGSTTHRA